MHLAMYPVWAVLSSSTAPPVKKYISLLSKAEEFMHVLCKPLQLVLKYMFLCKYAIVLQRKYKEKGNWIVELKHQFSWLLIHI